MAIPPTRLGSYPVERELGRGGMGVVYLARDPRLDRPVAVKVLPDVLALNPESLARFEREAKLLAALNHPNIASIYGVEDADGQRLLILEYVPGDTLAARIGRGPMPLDEALDIGRQIALAIEAAHEAGIIHRDLKPGNVKITPDGQVKVLDFGLAKGGSSSAASVDLAQSPTLTYSPTGVGVILGTAGYMSPEQARGRVVDRRTDIWSFGCVLFECLTGREIFGGETVSDTIARILEREPDWSALPANLPSKVRELLRRCLEKDVKKRQRDIGDVRIELEEVAAGRSSASRSGPIAQPAAGRRGPMGLGAASICVAIGAVAGIGLWSVWGPAGATASADPVRLSMAFPQSINVTATVFARNDHSVIATGFPRADDGTESRLPQLFRRRIDDYQFTPIPGTVGVEAMAMSSDGAWLAVVTPVSEQSIDRQLVKVPVDGSAPPVKIADWQNDWTTSIAWLHDGDLLVIAGRGTKFVRLPGREGPPKGEVTLDVSGFPEFRGVLPDDRGVFFSLESWGERGYQGDIWLLDPKTGKSKRLIENADNPIYTKSGYLLYSRSSALMAIGFDLKTLTTRGEAVAVLDGLRSNLWSNGTFDMSTDGHLLYASGGRLGNDRELIIVAPDGATSAFTTERRSYESSLDVSPDGRRAAVVIANAKGTYETWVAERDRPGLRRVLSLPNADAADAIWSPDDRWFAYQRTAHDKDDGVYVRKADGSGEPHAVLTSPDVNLSPSQWLPDSSGVVVRKSVGARSEAVVVPLSSTGAPGQPKPFRPTTASQCCVRFPPNGKLVAFESDESGQMSLYVAVFGPGGVVGTPLPVATGVTGVMWGSDGRRLYYSQRPGRIMSVVIESSPALRASAPTLAFNVAELRADEDLWEILPDGRLLTVRRGRGEGDVTSVNLVLNWAADLIARTARAAGGR